MKNIAAAFKFLTIWNRFTDFPPNPALVGKSAVFFPFIGLIFGLMLALLNRALEDTLDAEILSAALTTVLVLATGALHLEGMQKSFDSAPLRVPGTSGTSTAAIGVTAILLVILFKIRAIDILEVKLSLGLLLTPVLARWALVLFIYGSHRHSEGDARLIAENVKFWHLVLISFATLWPATYLLGRTALWIGFSLSMLALGYRTLLYKRKGLLTCNNFGLVVELGEALCLTLLASL
jgi:adenosylcobinamide-GDP ribazoletransferase